MSVSYSQDVRDDAVTSWRDTVRDVRSVQLTEHRSASADTLTAALDVRVHHLGADAVRPLLTGRVFPEEALCVSERTECQCSGDRGHQRTQCPGSVLTWMLPSVAKTSATGTDWTNCMKPGMTTIHCFFFFQDVFCSLFCHKVNILSQSDFIVSF